MLCSLVWVTGYHQSYRNKVKLGFIKFNGPRESFQLNGTMYVTVFEAQLLEVFKAYCLSV